MTVYAIHFCACGWQSDVHEDSDPPLKCRLCKRELHQTHAANRDDLLRTVATQMKKAASKDGRSQWWLADI